MKQYKLLKDYPPYEKGDIIKDRYETISYYEGDKGSPIRCSIVEQYSDYFAPHVFTTEDGVDIYVGDMYWWFTSSTFLYNQLCTTRSGKVVVYKYFSTKENAQQYFAELQAEKNIEWAEDALHKAAEIPIQKGSDYDIDKTCKTCVFEYADLNNTGICGTCAMSKLPRVNNWQLKEPKLMLGDRKAIVTHSGVTVNIYFVTTKQWLDWYDKVEQFYSIAKTGEIGIQLAQYDTLSVKHGSIEIGCIKDITLKQVRLVTEAIKSL